VKATCPNCQTSYLVADDKVPEVVLGISLVMDRFKTPQDVTFRVALRRHDVKVVSVSRLHQRVADHFPSPSGGPQEEADPVAAHQPRERIAYESHTSPFNHTNQPCICEP
jgi:hypothetical protein